MPLTFSHTDILIIVYYTQPWATVHIQDVNERSLQYSRKSSNNRTCTSHIQLFYHYILCMIFYDVNVTGEKAIGLLNEWFSCLYTAVIYSLKSHIQH